jgi:hypothetical protein
METEKILLHKVNELKVMLPKREWKYYHLGSIENFVFHLKNIKNDRTRVEIATQIDSFLSQVITKSRSDEKLLTKAMDLGPLLWRIALPYKNDLGFIKKPDILISLFMAFFSFVILCFFTSAVNSIVVCGLFYSLYLIFGFYKIKRRLVY